MITTTAVQIHTSKGNGAARLLSLQHSHSLLARFISARVARCYYSCSFSNYRFDEIYTTFIRYSFLIIFVVIWSILSASEILIKFCGFMFSHRIYDRSMLILISFNLHSLFNLFCVSLFLLASQITFTSFWLHSIESGRHRHAQNRIKSIVSVFGVRATHAFVIAWNRVECCAKFDSNSLER